MRIRSIAPPLLVFASLFLTGCMSPMEWWSRINHRARDVLTIRERHRVLAAEHEKLRLKYLELEHQYQSLRAEMEMAHAKRENKEIAGHEEGRHLANIKFKVPNSMPMAERAKLAEAHARHGKFQEAFVLFESFLWVPEGAPFQTVEAFYNAGVASFSIKNMNRAREYFEAATAHGDGLRDTEILRRTKLWLRVLDKRGEPADRKVASH